MFRSILAVCLLSSFASVAFADQWDKKTVVTFNEPVLVAGVPLVTLEPGTYVFRLVNSSSDRHIVQIFNERQDKLYTTVLAIANYRLEPKANAAFSFWETPIGNPRALHAWFYAGERFGEEFVYPKGLAANLARESGSTVIATPAQTEGDLQTLPLTEFNKAGEEERFIEEALAEPAPAPVEVAAAEPEPALEVAPAAEPAPAAEIAPLAEPAVLPGTASPFFALGLAGSLILILGVGLRRFSRA